MVYDAPCEAEDCVEDGEDEVEDALEEGKDALKEALRVQPGTSWSR
jgi:hypothetical protein